MEVTLRERPVRGKQGGGWFVRWRKDGQRHELKVAPPGPEHAERAERLRADLEQRLRYGTLWESGALQASLPLGEALRGWLETSRTWTSERTQVTNAGHVDRLITVLGAVSLRDLSESQVRDFARAALERWSSETVAVSLQVLRRVINVAVRDGLLPESPVPWLHEVIRDVRRKGVEEEPEPEFWSQDQAEAMVGATACKRWSRLRVPLVLAFYTGARRGEILALCWSDIDWERHRIRWRRTATLSGGTKLPKSGHGRMCPMSDLVEQELHAARRRNGLDEEHVAAWPAMARMEFLTALGELPGGHLRRSRSSIPEVPRDPPQLRFVGALLRRSGGACRNLGRGEPPCAGANLRARPARDRRDPLPRPRPAGIRCSRVLRQPVAASKNGGRGGRLGARVRRERQRSL